MRKLIPLVGIMTILPGFANVSNIDIAISNVRANCVGIAAELNHMKKIAGINTTVTGIGTTIGAGSLVAGIVKTKKRYRNRKLQCRHCRFRNNKK